MTESDLLELRLQSTGLGGTAFKSAAAAVAHLGAVQAQDYHAAKWALGLRVKGATDASIEKAFDAGKILRTHVLRPTWHFVTPENIRWMLHLTAPRVRARMAPYDRKLKLTPAVYTKAKATLAKAMGGLRHPTRDQLKQVLAGVGIKTDTMRLAHILMEAEQDGLLCSGPRAGKQFTYALIEERAPGAKVLPREEALARLAQLYFQSHGPAQLIDFSWWSGLSRADAQAGLDAIRSKLRQAVVDGKTYWFSPGRARGSVPRGAYLLSIYDEYTIAYTDGGALSADRGDLARLLKMGNALNSVIILDGKLEGTWKRILKKGRPEITLNPFRKLPLSGRELLEAEVARYEKFLE